jgi:hypothetical protein
MNREPQAGTAVSLAQSSAAFFGWRIGLVAERREGTKRS